MARLDPVTHPDMGDANVTSVGYPPRPLTEKVIGMGFHVCPPVVVCHNVADNVPPLLSFGPLVVKRNPVALVGHDMLIGTPEKVSLFCQSLPPSVV